MPGYLSSMLFLALASLPTLLPAQQAGIGPGGPSTLFGTLNITVKEGVNLPNGFFVVLYTISNRVLDRQSVVNHGTYKFSKVPNGDYEIAIELEGKDLTRIKYTLNTRIPNDERRLNLDFEWSGMPETSSSKAGTLSADDYYSRNAADEALMEQATAARGKKRYGEAAKLLKTIVAADSRDFEAWTDLGTVQFAQGDQEEAEKAFTRALEEHPSYPPALSNLGKLYYNRKNYDAAIKVLGKLVSTHPESAEAHRFLGESYLRIKKGSLAVPELEEAARLDPANQAEAHLSLAALYDAAGVKDRAASEYEKFLAKKPSYPEKKKLEKYIRDNKKH